MHHQQSLGNGDLLEFQKVPPPKNKYMYKDLQIIIGFCETGEAQWPDGGPLWTGTPSQK